MKHICQNSSCGTKEFESKRADAKYCSDACRKQAKRNTATADIPEEVKQRPLIEGVMIKYPPDLADYCMNNDITPAELIAFHKKYHNKTALFDATIKVPIADTSYLEQRRLSKLK